MKVVLGDRLLWREALAAAVGAIMLRCTLTKELSRTLASFRIHFSFKSQQPPNLLFCLIVLWVRCKDINMILTNINSVLFYTGSGWFWIANTQFHCKYETSWKQIGNIKIIPNICFSYSAFWSFARKKIVWKCVQNCSSLLNRSEMTDHIAFLLTQRITGSKRVTQLS